MHSDVLLVNNSGKPSYYAHYIPDLSLAYLSSSIKEKGYGVDVIDLNHLGVSENDVIEKISSQNPLFVGLKLIGNGLPEHLDLARRIKEQNPQTIIVAGGPQVTTYKESMLKSSENIDFLIYGEGERAVQEFVEFVEGKRKASDVRNFIYRNGGEIIVNPMQLERNLDSLAIPDWGVFDLSDYFPVFMINMVRGCQYQCSFCSHNYFWGREEPEENLVGKNIDEVKELNIFRRRSWANIRRELETDLNKYGVTLFEIVDSTPDISLLRQYTKWVSEEKVDLNWVSFGRVGYYDDALYQQFAKSGCIALWYGFESGNLDILKKMGKPYSIEDIKSTVRSAKKHGIKTIGAFMVGFPGETHETLEDTMRLMKELNVDTPILIPFFLQRGSPIHYNPSEYGVEIKEDWLDISLKPWCESEQHQIDYFSVNGLLSSAWWQQFEKQSGYKNWIDKRDLSETEIVELLGHLLDMTRENFITVTNTAISRGDKPQLSDLIEEAWGKSQQRAKLL